jgi:hypothetical protein
MEHGEVVLGAFFVSCGDAAEPFKPVEQALHSIARPIGLAVEAGSAALVVFAGITAPMRRQAQVVARGLARKGFVGGHPPRPMAWAATLPADRAGIEQGRQRQAVVPLAAAQLEGDWLAISLGANMDLGREPAPAPAERLALNPLFFAAAAGAGGVPMGTNHTAVDEVQIVVELPGGVGLGLQSLSALPDRYAGCPKSAERAR